ncbi:MAG TPA: choice-of-anchor P family protein [Gaiellaceae bacterium]|nr:choice-of-anchor P family protein [Gaiellaceae bacterium]
MILSLSASSQAQTTGAVTGSAYGASVSALTGSLPQTPAATLPATGDIADADLASVNVAGLLTTKTLSSVTTGVVGENAASAQSYSTVQDVSILNGVITAKLVEAMASSTGNGAQAASNAAGTTLVDLVINGVPTGVASPDPNTQIGIPGVGTLILNEQTPSGDGTTSSGLNVTALHLVLTKTDPLLGTTTKTGDIVVAAAGSSATFVR